MSFPRYLAYKDSGVEWLGAVPAHWNVTRVANVFLQVDEPGNEDLPILSVSIHTGVSDKEMNEQEMERKVTRSDDRSIYKRVAPGDLTYNMMRAWQGAFGAVATDGMVSPAYVVARPKGQFVTQFVEHQLRSPNAIEEMRRYSRGVTDFRLRLYWEDFKAIQLALPPVDDQIKIVQVLARETAKIDALVAEQEQLITLLKEKRQAVISHAVTKGLDPSVPMKDSGVEWLGEVPAHWLIKPVKQIGRLKGGAGFPHSEQGFEGEELCFYKVGALGQSAQTGYLTESENTISRETARTLGAFIFPKETLVFAKVGAALFLARVRSLPAEACLDNNMMGLVVDEMKHAPAFVRYAMSLVRFDLIANPGAVPSLNEGQIGNFALVCPPSKAEQEEVAAFLDRATGQLEELFAQAESMISTLRERRAALIAAAVTGQIDVRGWPPAQTTE